MVYMMTEQTMMRTEALTSGNGPSATTFDLYKEYRMTNQFDQMNHTDRVMALWERGMGVWDIAMTLGLDQAIVHDCIVADQSDAGDQYDQEQEEYEYDDSMDGDFDSAMASAGWGTDEDYGCGCEEY
jgi:hypothetical protein